jgi:peptidoglycan-N-acetylglucosamine deacetylase
MKIHLLILWMVLAVYAGLSGVRAEQPGSANDQAAIKRQMCVTFDGLPLDRSFTDVDRRLITSEVLEAMDVHSAKGAGFVVGENIEDSYDLLGEWLNRGHVLGNLTYSHQDLHQIGSENFIREINLGAEALEVMLAGFGQKKRYFRYPYLHYGHSVADKREVRMFLAERNDVVTHASIVVEDYLYNLSLEKLGSKADSADYLELMGEYLNHVLDEVEKAESQSMQLLGRNCRHILQLRLNRLNAAFLNDMLIALKTMGYEFIPLDEALKDELYSRPEAYFESRGVSYLEMIFFSDPDLLPAE